MYLSTVFTSSAGGLYIIFCNLKKVGVYSALYNSSLAHARTVKALAMWWCVLVGAVLLSSQGKLQDTIDTLVVL